MPRAPKPPGSRPIEQITHADTRRNIPTAEHQSLAQRAEEQSPVEPVCYPRATPLEPGETRPRNEDLDPQLIWRGAKIKLTREQQAQLIETGEVEIGDAQLVWRGKDQQDWSDLVVNPPPIYIQENIHPKAIIEGLRKNPALAPRLRPTPPTSSPTSTASTTPKPSSTSTSTTSTGRTA